MDGLKNNLSSRYSKRIQTLCQLLTPCKTFADVGCDHGYCTEYMLKNGLCEHAVFSDVSRGSLAKAQLLLQEFVKADKATAVLGDGFYGVPKDVDLVLIAGMGGSEMISILSDETYGFLPKRFVFQPMHDSEKLRRYIHQQGGWILEDYTFFDGKYYDVIVGYAQAEAPQTYTAAEYEFGQGNLRNRPQAFLDRTQKQIDDLERYMAMPSLQAHSKAELLQRQTRLQGVLNGEIK